MTILKIRTSADLASISGGVGNWAGFGIESPGIDQATSRRLSLSLAKNYRSCGCDGARWGAGIGLVAATAWSAYIGTTYTIGLVWIVAAMTVAGALGSAIELAVARIRLNQTLRELSELLQ